MKNDGFCEKFLSEIDVEAILTTPYVVMAVVLTLLRQFRSSLQMKKSIINVSRVL